MKTTAAVEVVFDGLLHDGTEEHRCSSYYFDVAADGTFSRVIVWIDGETPQSAGIGTAVPGDESREPQR